MEYRVLGKYVVTNRIRKRQHRRVTPIHIPITADDWTHHLGRRKRVWLNYDDKQ